MSDSDDDLELEPYEVVYDGDENKKAYLIRDGQAKASFPNGDSYTGGYVSRARHGQGTYVYAKAKAWYRGDWQHGVKHGIGTMRYPDTSRYVGEWRCNQRCGVGTYTYANGDRYCGHWHNDVRHGTGTYFYAQDQTSVEGEWIDGQLPQGTWSLYEQRPFQAALLNGQVQHYAESAR